MVDWLLGFNGWGFGFAGFGFPVAVPTLAFRWSGVEVARAQEVIQRMVKLCFVDPWNACSGAGIDNSKGGGRKIVFHDDGLFIC